MYNSIVGEKKYRNAGGDELASINAAILDTTSRLNEATRLFNEAAANLTACNGLSQNACLAKTGGYAHSTWSPQYDNNKALIPQLKTQLTEQLKLQKQISDSLAATAVSTTQTAAANQAQAQAQESLAKADVATTGAQASKVGLYIGIGVGVVALVLGGLYFYKKMKK